MLLTNSDTMALGELVIELSGKITGQRVLDVEGPTIERSIISKGTIRGVQVQDITTFIGRPTAEKGVLHSVGQGVTTTTAGRAGGEPEMVTHIGEGIGRFGSSGGVKWRGSVFSRTSSGGKLAFLNNMIGVFENEINADGNFSEKIWEWKIKKDQIDCIFDCIPSKRFILYLSSYKISIVLYLGIRKIAGLQCIALLYPFILPFSTLYDRYHQIGMDGLQLQ